MDFIALLLFLLWLASGVLVVRFVLHTKWYTIAGRVAHWFGGAFVMIGLAAGLVWVYARLDGNFGARVNVYVLTHQARPGDTATLIQRHGSGDLVTVYRPGSFNTAARLVNGQLIIDERQNVRTSWWWMLWDTRD